MRPKRAVAVKVPAASRCASSATGSVIAGSRGVAGSSSCCPPSRRPPGGTAAWPGPRRRIPRRRALLGGTSWPCLSREHLAIDEGAAAARPPPRCGRGRRLGGRGRRERAARPPARAASRRACAGSRQPPRCCRPRSRAGGRPADMPRRAVPSRGCAHRRPGLARAPRRSRACAISSRWSAASSRARAVSSRWREVCRRTSRLRSCTCGSVPDARSISLAAWSRSAAS